MRPQQPIIEFGPKKYLLVDLLLYTFFNALTEEQQSRFLRDYEVLNMHADYVSPASAMSMTYPPDITKG